MTKPKISTVAHQSKPLPAKDQLVGFGAVQYGLSLSTLQSSVECGDNTFIRSSGQLEQMVIVNGQ